MTDKKPQLLVEGGVMVMRQLRVEPESSADFIFASFMPTFYTYKGNIPDSLLSGLPV